ncbi:molecular chaperone TorD [Gordonibacter sp. An230]|uniref:TorD/DmsD family molecular chaperone n=1 Tax=Gordonibacter sp. An230 TaxID=1965592 RepID=UPI000B57B32B|nr:molecular chaperone TorD family protein [Gordonibacter sp. An230]OUO91722.1 molecular chaperone TorD [Gordonibacter sp. An230]
MAVIEGETMGAATWQVRASACELLSLSLRYPDDALVRIVVSGEWADAAREIWGALGIALPADWAVGAEEAELHALRAEATRLFVGAPQAVCSPYEGFWRANDDGVQPLMFVNPHSMAVERFCKECGLGQAKGSPNEPLDHIATEFELLQYLASVEAGIVELRPGGPSASDFPGGGAGAAYGRFEADHLRTFAPRFADRLEAEARVPYYRAVAQLLSAYLQ